MENKFFTFIKPFLNYIDSGNLYIKPFKWLYILLGIANLFFPIYIFYQAVERHIFDTSDKFVIAFILVWIIIVFASWISFQLWWDRKSKVESISVDGDDFLATPVFSHLLQTIGEWLGAWIGVVGFSVSFLITIILGDDDYNLSRRIGLGFMNLGIFSMILMPIYGFFIIIITRFLAEQFCALSSIANNTKRINIRNNKD